MNVRAKLINKSSDNINMNRAAKDIATDIASAFNGKVTLNGKAYSLQTNIQLGVANSMADVIDSDHLFVLSDTNDAPKLLGGKARGATNESGGKAMSILASDYRNNNWLSNRFDNNTRSTVHEFGHTLNLPHEEGAGNYYNLMRLGEAGTTVEDYQRGIMVYYALSGGLNRGRNSFGTGKDKVPNFMYRGMHINQIGITHR